jgi:hypothetical protein
LREESAIFSKEKQVEDSFKYKKFLLIKWDLIKTKKLKMLEEAF